MTDPLLRFRPEFPILATTNYMVSNSLGAMPRSVPGHLAEYAEQWATRGVRAWAQGWWEMPITVGNEIAPLIGAGPNEVAMVPNVSIAQAQLFSALDYTTDGRDTIVMSEMDFPSVRYVYDQLATRLGARIARDRSALGTLEAIERLAPRVVIPGHGEPFEDVARAIATGRSRLEAFAADPRRNARHVMKVMFVFALLDRRGMALADVPGYFGRIACYRQLSQRFLGSNPEDQAEALIADLERVGAVQVISGMVLPTAEA